MRKLLLGLCSLAAVSSLSIAIPLCTTSASADVAPQSVELFTETKCQISDNGERMLIVTGINDVSKIYNMGYEINGDYTVQEGDTAETNKWYASLTLGAHTRTASQFFAGAQGLLIWEVAYDPTIAYTITPYAYVGEMKDGLLYRPSVEVATPGITKGDFNVFTVTYQDEDGTVIDTASVNYGAQAIAIDAPAKDGHTFDNWYVGNDVYDFTQKVTGNLTLTAKYKAPVKYTVQVQAVQYNQGYTSPFYYPGTKGWVDATSDFAEVFGLDENNQLSAMPGSTVDLSKKVAELKGVKLDASSTASGVVKEDGSLELVLKLDFDEEVLGFGMDDIKLGEWNCDHLTFTLGGNNGVYGLYIDGGIANVREITIDVDDFDASKYAAVNFIFENFTELDKNTEMKYADADGTFSASWSSSFTKSVDMLQLFSGLTNVTQVKLKVNGGGANLTERKLFIGGFEFKQYTRKNVTYSADNNNIEEIATTATLGRGGFSTGKIYFVNNDEGISQSENALIYAYEGEQVTGMHATGLVLDLGLLKVSDYKTIKLLFQADVGGAGCGTNVICDSTEVASLYGGAHIVDLKALAEGKKLTSFSKLELSASSWGKLTSHKIYVGFIELELADGIEEDVEAPAEPEVPEIPDVPEEPEIPDVPAGPQSVTYSIANNNLWDIVTPLNNGTLSEVGWQGIVSLQYNYNSDEDIIAQHVAGIVLDLGKIKVSDYSSITLKYQTSGISEGGANIWLDGKNCASKYGGVQTIDLIAIANENGVTEFSTLELSFQGWNNAVIVKNYTLNFGYLELIVAE